MTPLPNSIRRDFWAGVMPWILYGMGYQLGYIEIGALAAALSLFAIRWSHWKETKLYDATIFGFFLLVFLGGYCFEWGWIDQYRAVLAPLLLALAAFGSSLIGRPYTLQYAKQFAQPFWWENPHFIRVNHILTLFWAGCFFLGVAIAYSMIWYQWPSTIGYVFFSVILMTSAAWFTKQFPKWYRFYYYLPLVKAGKEPYLPAPKF